MNRLANAATRPLPRVRHEPPTLAEAIAAAEGLSADRNEQIGIAASLMGVPVEEVQTFVAARHSARVQRSVSRTGASFVVERKSRTTSRRAISAGGR